MLVLTRKAGEEIVIDGVIRVRIISMKGRHVRVGVSAPPDVVVDRAEVAFRREFQTQPTKVAPRRRRELVRSR
jgi:carbon storage regulator